MLTLAHRVDGSVVHEPVPLEACEVSLQGCQLHGRGRLAPTMWLVSVVHPAGAFELACSTRRAQIDRFVEAMPVALRGRLVEPDRMMMVSGEPMHMTTGWWALRRAVRAGERIGGVGER